LSEITANIQTLAANNSGAMKRPAGVANGGEEDKDDADEDADEESEHAPSKKARTNKSSPPSKAQPSKQQSSKPKVKPAAVKPKATSSKQIASPADSRKIASFEFVDPRGKQLKPRRFSDITIYTDTVNKTFRVKPGVGRRDHTQFGYASDSRQAWREVVKLAKKIM
jgi:hypothetical protein